MKTKIFTLLFATLVCVGTMFAEATLIGELNYILDAATQTAEVTERLNPDRKNYSSILGALTIPSTVNYNGVTYTVTSIGEDAFHSCEGLTSVTLPNTLNAIVEEAFYGCSSLVSITIPGGVITIGERAFCYCRSMTSLTLEDGVTTLELSAFGGCSGLTSVTLPNSITSIGNQAFENCSSLVSINIPSSVTYIGTYAFEGCESLASPIVIPEGVTKLDDGVFINCSSLTSISLPQSLKRLEGTYFGTFAGCDGLETIYVHRDTPANADSNTFNGVDKYSCTLYVPRNSISLYESASVWRDFYNIEAIEDVMAVDEIDADGTHGQKVVRDGQVLIEHGDKTYTLTGAEVK